jgi:hypothetical protein
MRAAMRGVVGGTAMVVALGVVAVPIRDAEA